MRSAHILEPIWVPGIHNLILGFLKILRIILKLKKRILINYFSRVNEYCALFPDDFVLKYGIIRVRNKKIFDDNIPLFESLLLKSMQVQSSCIPNVVEMLSLKDINYEGKIDRIGETISELNSIHSKYSNDFEIAWALWLGKRNEFCNGK